MALIERGVHLAGFRGTLIFQTVDTVSHSLVTKNSECFEKVMTEAADQMRENLKLRVKAMQDEQLVEKKK